jgi:hypothetical protein
LKNKEKRKKIKFREDKETIDKVVDSRNNCINRSLIINNTINQSLFFYQPIKQSANHSINQPTNQSINQ